MNNQPKIDFCFSTNHNLPRKRQFAFAKKLSLTPRPTNLGFQDQARQIFPEQFDNPLSLAPQDRSPERN